MAYMRAALVQPELLNYRPSVVSAAVLYTDRLSRGELPFWPSALAHLTGYSLSQTPELAAAVSTLQRCVHALLPSPSCGWSQLLPECAANQQLSFLKGGKLHWSLQDGICCSQ
jgi:hypothetical protein